MRKTLALSTVLYYAAAVVAAYGIQYWIERVDLFLKPEQDASLYGLAFIIVLLTGAAGLLPVVLTAVAVFAKSLNRKALLTFSTICLTVQLLAGAFYVYVASGSQEAGDHLLRPWLYGAAGIHLLAGLTLVWGARSRSAA